MGFALPHGSLSRIFDQALSSFQSKIRQGTGDYRILAIGDSVTEGFTSGETVSFSNRWANLLAPNSRVALGYAANTNRFVNSSYTAGFTEIFTRTPTVVENATFGIGLKAAILGAAATTTINIGTACTGFDLYYALGTTGTFNWSIDGGATTTINTANASVVSSRVTKVRSIAAPAVGNLLIAPFGGLSVAVEGVQTFNGNESTLHVINAGHAGFAVSDFNTNSVQVGHTVTGTAPDLVLIALGLNDYGTVGKQVTLATFITNMNALIATVKAAQPTASIALVIPHERAVLVAGTPDQPWSAWIAAYYAIGAAQGCAVIDTSAAVGSFVTPGNPNDSGDQLHPNTAGHAVIEQVVRSRILP